MSSNEAEALYELQRAEGEGLYGARIPEEEDTAIVEHTTVSTTRITKPVDLEQALHEKLARMSDNDSDILTRLLMKYETDVILMNMANRHFSIARRIAEDKEATVREQLIAPEELGIYNALRQAADRTALLESRIEAIWQDRNLGGQS